jgi:hypothetical protein
VFWDKMTGRWRCQLTHKSCKVNLGRFSDPEEAARAYDRKLVELKGAAGGGLGTCMGIALPRVLAGRVSFC